MRKIGIILTLVVACALFVSCDAKTTTDTITGPVVKDTQDPQTPVAEKVDWVKIGVETMDGLFEEFNAETQDTSLTVGELSDVVFKGVEYGAKAGDGWKKPFGKTTVEGFVKALKGAIDIGLITLGDYELFGPDTPGAKIAVAVTNAFGMKYIEAIKDGSVTVEELIDAVLAPIKVALAETGNWNKPVPTLSGATTTVGVIWEASVLAAKTIMAPFGALDYVVFTLDDPAAAVTAVENNLRSLPLPTSP